MNHYSSNVTSFYHKTRGLRVRQTERLEESKPIKTDEGADFFRTLQKQAKQTDVKYEYRDLVVFAIRPRNT